MKLMRPKADRVALSIAHVNRIRGQHYADLPGTIALMQDLLRVGAVDGFELQNLAEWDATEPPRDEHDKRLAAWQASQKYSVEAIAAHLKEAAAPVLSVHANRDVGICLCAGHEQDIARGRLLIHESLWLAHAVGAPVCVFHLWDTWKESFDPAVLHDALDTIAPQYPDVKAAVENVPTHLGDYTPFELAKTFTWITLDTRWAGLYDELDRFAAIKDRIANVHLQGRLENGRWAAFGHEAFTFDEALETIRGWGYSGLWTVEASGLSGAMWDDLVAAMHALPIHRM